MEPRESGSSVVRAEATKIELGLVLGLKLGLKLGLELDLTLGLVSYSPSTICEHRRVEYGVASNHARL